MAQTIRHGGCHVVARLLVVATVACGVLPAARAIEAGGWVP